MIHAIVDLDPVSFPSSDFDWATERFPTLIERVHERTSLEPTPFPDSANTGAVIAWLALTLQRIAGIPVRFSFGRPRSQDTGFDVVVRHRHPAVGLGAVHLAIRWIARQFDSETTSFDLIEEFDRFVSVVRSHDHEIMGRALAAAAADRGIPSSLIDPRGVIIELGTGCYRKRYVGTLTSSSPYTSTVIARDKFLTSHYLQAAGLPVPDSMLARTLGQTLHAARTIGYPVVLKPVDQGGAAGVFVDLRNDDDIRAIYDEVMRIASQRNPTIMVEQFARGRDYRATVVGSTVVAVSERIYPRVIGDGLHTVAQLIAIENTNPRRGTSAASVYHPIVVDDEILANLAHLQWSLASILPVDHEIVLKKSGHRRDGAIHIDVTDRIHPANITLLRTATRVVGLDIAGIDLIAPDIAKPMLETGGVFIEINESTAFNLQLFPAAGAARDPAPAIMDMLFPPGTPVRIPVVAIMGDADAATLCQKLARSIAAAGFAVGMANSREIIIGGVRYPNRDSRNPAGPRTLFDNPDTEFAIVEIDPVSIAQHGLGFDRCDIVIVLSRSEQKTPFGQPVETVLLRTLAPGGTAILNAADPHVRMLAANIEQATILVGFTADDPEIPSFTAMGYTTANSERTENTSDQSIVLYRNRQEPRPIDDLTGHQDLLQQIEAIVIALLDDIPVLLS